LIVKQAVTEISTKYVIDAFKNIVITIIITLYMFPVIKEQWDIFKEFGAQEVE